MDVSRFHVGGDQESEIDAHAALTVCTMYRRTSNRMRPRPVGCPPLLVVSGWRALTTTRAHVCQSLLRSCPTTWSDHWRCATFSQKREHTHPTSSVYKMCTRQYTLSRPSTPPRQPSHRSHTRGQTRRHQRCSTTQCTATPTGLVEQWAARWDGAALTTAYKHASLGT